MQGVETAYYLVPSVAPATAREDDHRAAAAFAETARQAGVRRIIYLGGLGANGRDVGRLLAESGVPTIELRAFIIIGSGSLSFEMLRALTEKFPVILAPRWFRTRTQPIAIEDVVAYLLEALRLDTGGVFEIGGADQVSYADLIRDYARARGLRRLLVPFPMMARGLSSYCLGLLTPLYARAARKVIDSLHGDAAMSNGHAREAFAVRPRGVREAIERALRHEDRQFAETRWSDALSAPEQTNRWGGVRVGARLVESRALRLPCAPAAAFRPIRRIGGTTGWYYANWLWRLRGFLDVLIGGVGLRRGRRDPEWPHPGDTLDFWRVEAYEPDRLLRLYAEMKVPGRAWLQFEVEGGNSQSTVRMTAIFDPAGLTGLLYWYSLYPLHKLIFTGMLRKMAAAISEPEASPG
jgi:uncharacterized protein YbjT (DUF2867 family)